MEPRVLKCPKVGIIIEVDRKRTWSTVIARTASSVFVKKMKSAELDLCADDFEYPKGIGEAARRFRYPVTGVAAVTPEAVTILENIMTAYAINTTTGKVVGAFPDVVAAQAVAGENPTIKTVVTASDIAENLTASQIGDTLAQLTGKDIGRIRNKSVAAEQVMGELEAAFPAPAPEPVMGSRPDSHEVPAAKKGSVKDKLRQLFSKKDSYTFEELLLATKASTGALTTALSDLKNSKYAAGPVLVLKRDRKTDVISKEA